MMGMFLRHALERIGPHPSSRLLTSFSHGELVEKRRIRLVKHLEHCSRCRSRAADIRQDWDFLAELNVAGRPPVSESDIAPKLNDSIRTWIASHPFESGSEKHAFDEAETARRIEAVLGVYLGKRAAAAIAGSGDELRFSGQDTSASPGSALRILLGEKSAAAIETKLRQITGGATRSMGRSLTR